MTAATSAVAAPAPRAGIPQRSKVGMDLPVTTSTGILLISNNLAVVKFSNNLLRVFSLRTNHNPTASESLCFVSQGLSLIAANVSK